MKLGLGKQATTPDGVISPVRGSFDLSDGAFKVAENRRRILLGVSLGSLAVLTALAMSGLFAMMRADTASNSTYQAAADRQQALSTLAKIDQAEGYPAETLRSHVQPRQTALGAALKSDVDLAALTNAILAATPPSLNVSSVTVTWSDPNADKAGASASAAPDPVAAVDPNAPSPSASALPVKKDMVITLTIVATGDFQAILDMKAAISQIMGVTPMVEDPTWTGAGTQTTVTFVTTLNKDAASARAKAVTDSDAFGQPKPVDSAAPAPSSQAQPGTPTVVPIAPSAQPAPSAVIPPAVVPSAVVPSGGGQ